MRWGMALVGACLLARAAADEPRTLIYGGLVEKRVWTVEIAEDGEWTFPDFDRGKSVSHHSLVLASDPPRAGVPARIGVFLAKEVTESESQRRGKGKLVVEPPNSRSTTDEGVGMSGTVGVDTKRGPKLQFVGYVALDGNGKWLETRTRPKAASDEAPRIGELWPELPGKPLAVGLRWKEQKEFHTAFTKEVVLELNLEVVSIEKSPDGPVAVLKLKVERTFSRDELDDERRSVQMLSETASGRYVLDGTARVRADAPEWLGTEATIRQSLLDGKETFSSIDKLSMTLAPKPVLYCDCDAVLAVQLR